MFPPRTTLVDNDQLAISSLEPNINKRTIVVKVADVAALLVAKAHKINNRLQQCPGRLTHKDAGDVVRLMQTSIPSDVAELIVRGAKGALAQ